MTMTSPSTSDARDPGPRKRKGSRLLLAIALLGGIAAALFLGSSVPEILAGLAGIASRTLRLVLKVVGVIVALPVAFYFVERFFLRRSGRE
jgi:hypothetical protein